METKINKPARIVICLLFAASIGGRLGKAVAGSGLSGALGELSLGVGLGLFAWQITRPNLSSAE